MSFKKECIKDQKLEKIIDEIEHSYQDMRVIRNHFDLTIDPSLIEYYIYQYKAAEVKHDYLLKKVKDIYYKVNN